MRIGFVTTVITAGLAIALSGPRRGSGWAAQPDQGPPASGPQPGVVVRIYQSETELSLLPELVEGQLPNHVVLATSIDFDSQRADFGPFQERFVTQVSGILSVPQDGAWGLRLISDDGARLYLDSRLVIDHDGLHGPDPKDAVLQLSAGHHRLRIYHFQNAGGAYLALRWRRPGATQFEPIPPSALLRDEIGPFDTAAGPKRMIPALRRGRPGDGAPLQLPHPAFTPSPTAASAAPDLTDWLRTGRIQPMNESGPAMDQVRVWLPADGEPAAYECLLRLEAQPYRGQLVAARRQRAEAKRIILEEIEGRLQGGATRFGLLEGCGLREAGTPPFEIRSVRALANGLEVEFTRPLDPRVGWEPESYYLEQWPFDLSAAIRPHRDGQVYAVRSASVSEDRRRVFLEIDSLRPSHVLYPRLLPPCLSEDGDLPWSTEVWYTLHALPTDSFGSVRTPPPEPPQNVLSDLERQQGWRLLFDGQTTQGWRGWRKDHCPEGWQVINGCLVRVAPAGDLTTIEEFDDFELSLEWRISPGGNSGIFFRADERLEYPWQSAPEMQVLDNAEHPDGKNPRTSAGANYALHAPSRDVTQPVGLFNRVRIVACGNHVEHWLNDVKVVEYELGSPEWEKLVAESKFKTMPHYGRVRRGHIVLQDHGDKVWYRNIKIRPLSPK